MTEQSFETIAQKVSGNDRDSWSYKLCALRVDEIELKKQLEVDHTTGKLYGFTHWLRLALQHCVHWFFRSSGHLA